MLLRFARETVGIEHTASEDADWLAEFLTPQWELIDNGTSPSCQVSFIRDADEFEMLHRRGPDPRGKIVHCFALDRRMVELPVWTGLDNETVIFDHELCSFYRVRHDPLRITILGSPANPSRPRLAAMRVIRELGVSNGLELSGVVLHASAFALDGQGIVIAGAKKAGKTSLLIESLRARGARYISNDRVMLFPQETVARIHGIPSIVVVRSPTLGLFPEFAERVRCSRYHSLISIAEAQRSSSGPAVPDAEGRFHLSPPQFCELVGSRSCSQAPLSAIVFPAVTDRPGSIRVTRLRPDQVRNRLPSAVFGSGGSRQAGDVFSRRRAEGTGDPMQVVDSMKRLTESVPCFDVQLGREAFQGTQWTEGLKEQITKDVAAPID